MPVIVILVVSFCVSCDSNNMSCDVLIFSFILQMSFASLSAAVFAAKAVCGRHHISFSLFCCWNILVSLSTL